MTVNDTLKLFAAIKANYGNFFKTISRDDANAMVNLWVEMFADKPYELVSAAVMAYISTDTTGYPPNVGQINEQIRKLTSAEDMSEQEAMNLIKKAVGNSGYNSSEEFEKLPAVLQRLVGSPTQLREWAMMDIEEFGTVISSNLMRSYRAISKREQEAAKLPHSIRQILLNGASALKSID